MTLPRGWASVTLGECMGKTSTVDPQKYLGETFDLYSVPSYTAYEPETLQGSAIGSTKQEVQEGDVLLCKIVPHIRRGWAVPKAQERRQIASGEWIVFRGHGLETEYLRRFVLSDDFHEQFMQTVSGVGGSLMRARPSEAGKIAIPVPPLAEQRRIVKKLDALTTRITRARAELERTEALAHRLRASSLQGCFEGGNGAFVPLASVLEDVRYGTSKKCDYNAGSIPVLRIPNIQGGKVDTQDLKSADFDRKEIEKLSLRSGDVLVIRSNGSLDLVGKSAVVTQANAGMLYAGYLIRLRPQATTIRPAYLQAFLSSPATRSIIENCAKSTSGVNNVNAEQLKGLLVPLPPLREQDRVIATVEKAFTHADSLEAEAARVKTLLDRLESAILAQAFKGELVPQDPADEPAETLLTRIRATRAAAPDKRGRRKAG